jgi:hypothetical protein
VKKRHCVEAAPVYYQLSLVLGENLRAQLWCAQAIAVGNKGLPSEENQPQNGEHSDAMCSLC